MTSPIAQKLAFRFLKIGRARFHSHLDIVRFFERAVRRAQLPVRLTEGYNPRPRIVFPHALGVGVASWCESVEIEFSRRVDPEKVLVALRKALAPLLTIEDCRRLPPLRRGRTVKRTVYLLRGWPDAERLRGAVASLLQAEHVECVRGEEGHQRRVDARPYLLDAKAEGTTVRLALKHTETGAGRPDEIVEWLATRLDVDPLTIRIEKIQMDFA